MAKDAKGHGSESRGGSYQSAMQTFGMAHRELLHGGDRYGAARVRAEPQGYAMSVGQMNKVLDAGDAAASGNRRGLAGALRAARAAGVGRSAVKSIGVQRTWPMRQRPTGVYR